MLKESNTFDPITVPDEDLLEGSSPNEGNALTLKVDENAPIENGDPTYAIAPNTEGETDSSQEDANSTNPSGCESINPGGDENAAPTENESVDPGESGGVDPVEDESSQSHSKPQAHESEHILNDSELKEDYRKIKRAYKVVGILAIVIICLNIIQIGTHFSSGKGITTEISKAPTVVVNQLTESDGVITASEIYEKYAPAVVAVQTEIVTTNFWGMPVSGVAAGSGFFISSDGYILTNYHVIENANSIKITTKDQSSYEAKVVGYEKENDVAILKVDNMSGITSVVIGDSDAMTPGEDVVMIGNPLGSLTWSISKGIISALNREMTTDLYTNLNMFQVDSPVNQGNSGGPLFNMRGEVLGIVSAKYASTTIEGLGFCIPINDAISIAKELIENGKVTNKGAIGVTLADVSQDMISNYGMVAGAYIVEVNTGSAAEKAGIKKGDIVTAIDGKEVNSASALRAAFRSHKAGEEAVLTVYRSGESIEVNVVFEAAKDEVEFSQKSGQSSSQQGMSIEDIFKNWSSLF